MKTLLLITLFVFSGMPLCLSQTITRQDLMKTLQHISRLAKEQKVQLESAKVDLVKVSQQAEKLNAENQHLKAKANEALKRFLCLYVIITGLIAIIFRAPIFKALTFLVKPL